MTKMRNDAFDADSMSEDELYDLFGAFDDVNASEDLKAATLERIGQLEETAKHDRPAGEAESIGIIKTENSGDEPSFKALAGGKTVEQGPSKMHPKAKWRTLRVAAVAACLVLALSGGVAYAIPTSYVTVSQGDMSIELAVNRFGITVNASSSDEEVARAIEDVNLRHISYEESLSRACESLESMRPDEPVELSVRSDDNGQRGSLEAENAEFLVKHTEAEPPEPEGPGANNGPDQNVDVGDGFGGDQAPQPENAGNDDAPRPQEDPGKPEANSPDRNL